MSTPAHSHRTQKKKSGCVTLTIVGISVGVVALCIYSCTKDEEVSDDDVTYVSHGRSYSSNHHIPGVGYYHAPFHAWFPNRYNQHDPSRGYYYDGRWNASQHTSPIVDSTPTSSAVSNANSQWRSANPAEFASRKASMASARSSSRGGFGFSGRSSSS
jgi:hypothetical protein